MAVGTNETDAISITTEAHLGGTASLSFLIVTKAVIFHF
jgi:hypothetical protein